MVRSYDELLRRIEAAADHGAARVETLGTFASGGIDYPIALVHLGEPGPRKLGVTISAGIHGDEPAGPEAALEFIRQNRHNEQLLSRFHFIIFPCDNPTGWELNTRENVDGLDVNRQFAAPQPSPEAVIISNALKGRCFDLVIEMHEDIDSPGFYMYELIENSSRSVGPEIIAKVVELGYPVNTSRSIEGRRAKGGLISPTIRRFRKTRLPKAVYTYQQCGGHVITLETPASVLPLEDRVKIQLMSLQTVLDREVSR